MKFYLLFLLINSINCKNTQSKIGDDKVAMQEFCGSKICLLDVAQLIHLTSDDTEFIDPCDDFKGFAFGNSITRNSLNDNFGLSFDIPTLHRKRLLKILNMQINGRDARVTKIAKNFFQKCIDSQYIQTVSKYEFEKYVLDKSFPLIDGADWKPEKVNLTANLFDPSFKFEMLVFHKLSRCINPRDPDSQIFCWKLKSDFLNRIKINDQRENIQRALYKRLKEIDIVIKVDDALVNASINHFVEFYDEINSSEEVTNPSLMRIKTLKSYIIPNATIYIDWLQLINKEFLEHSKAYSDNEEILIENWKIFSKGLKLYEMTSPRKIMDVLFLIFVYQYVHVYSFHPFKKIDSSKRATERYDQCLEILEENFSPALLSLYAKFYLTNRTIQESETFAREAITDVLNEITNAKNIEKTIVDDLKRKLKKIKIILGILPEMLIDERMEDIYNELKLNGDGILETTIKIINYNNKLENEPINSWLYLVNQLSTLRSIKYFPNRDMLFIPVEYLHYPFYDVNRLRYFNTATLYTEIVVNINKGIKDYLKNEYKQDYALKIDSVKMGYFNYVTWENKNKNTEKLLPGFNLSNRQMYWLAYANLYFKKYAANALDALNIQYTYAHVWFKSRPEFRESFNCTEMNDKENSQYEVFKKMLYNVY